MPTSAVNVSIVQAGVEGAVRQITRTGLPRDLCSLEDDDLRNQGLMVALAACRQRFDPRKGNLQGFAFRIALRAIGNYVSRMLATPSVPQSYERGIELRGRCRIGASGGIQGGYQARRGEPDERVPVELWSCEPSAEAKLLQDERDRRMAEWRVAAQAAIRRVLADLSAQDRAAVRRLWGLDGRPPDRDCGRVARQLGMDVAAVYTISKKLRRRFDASRELRHLYGASLEIREEETSCR